MAKRGKFIVIEGSDGAGKDTQIDFLKKDFHKNGNMVFTRDPGGTETSLAIRKLLLTKHKNAIIPSVEFLLFLAARAQLAGEYIEPMLHKGKHVVCHRFELSTLAYQLHGRKQALSRELLVGVTNFAMSTTPDLYILLDVDPKVGMERTKKGKGNNRDRFEKEKIDFFKRVNKAYRTEIKNYPHVIIDGSRTPEEVYKEVRAVVDREIDSSV